MCWKDIFKRWSQYPREHNYTYDNWYHLRGMFFIADKIGTLFSKVMLFWKSAANNTW